MDSMRSLDTSLPTSPPKPRPLNPPEKLLQSFKVAALSVTNLYKEAASEQAEARHAGYQEALDHLLGFLDKENIGLDDGEGWRVRQWATERLDGVDASHTGQSSTDSDEDKAEADRARSFSPAEQQRENRIEPGKGTSTRTASPSATQRQQPEPSPPTPSEIFTFRSAISLPAPSDSDMDLTLNDGASANISPGHGGSHTSSVRLEVVPKGSRNRHGSSSGRTSTRSSSNFGPLGSAAGHKRRIPFGDFFDIGSLGTRDGNGATAKRGRYT
ncbi:MAG: hypothetical protein M1825_006218 [Sarcosagium campestre]|nr:MAG: hypothetical protein M1825_006218 [Sarcosagium campestre]